MRIFSKRAGIPLGGGGVVTVPAAGNQPGATINQNDTTNNPTGIAVNNLGTGSDIKTIHTAGTGSGVDISNGGVAPYSAGSNNALLKVKATNSSDTGDLAFLWTNGAGQRALKIYVDSTTGQGINVRDSSAGSNVETRIVDSRAATTGSNYFTRNLAAANTAGPIVNIAQTNTGDDQPALQVAGSEVNVPVALTDAANIATNASLGNTFKVTLGGNRTIDNPTNPIDGQKIIYRLKQDATGTRLITWGSAFRFGTTVPSPTLSVAATKVDYIEFQYDATDAKWDCLRAVTGY